MKRIFAALFILIFVLFIITIVFLNDGEIVRIAIPTPFPIEVWGY